MLNDSFESEVVDPAMVSSLIHAISNAIEQTCIPEVTTTADLLSALFTSLDAALRMSRADAAPEDAAYNSTEIGRVLMDLLVEFGTPTNPLKLN